MRKTCAERWREGGEALAEHLTGLRLLPAGTRLTQADLKRAIEVREALRWLRTRIRDLGF